MKRTILIHRKTRRKNNLKIPLQSPLYKKINEPLAFYLAGSLEWMARILQKVKEPVLTKYTVCVLCKSQILNIEKEKRELGYQPKITIEEGIELFTKWKKEESP
jgi:nucleoside-diphosphate-sugar epimerase